MIAGACFNIADVVDHCWDESPAIASANLLIAVLWSLDTRLWVFSNTGKLLSREFVLSRSVVVNREEIKKFFVGRFVLSPSDECMFGGQCSFV